MHEHIFIQNIINQVPDNNNVKSIEIELGVLVGIEPDHLKEHLEEQTGWRVFCKVINSKVECRCGYKGEARILQRLHDLVVYDCPDCEEDPKVIQGKDIKITKVVYKS